MSTVDESLAKALGIEECACFGWPAGTCHRANGDHFDSGNDDGLPVWSGSMDACLRDIVPVLRARGWRYRIQDDIEDVWVEMRRVRPEFRFQPSAEFTWTGSQVWMQAVGERAVSLPAAFCEAALKALEASKPTAVAH